MHALQRHGQHFRQYRQRLSTTLPRTLLVHGFGRRIFLHIGVTALATVQVDGECIFRHVGVVDAEALDLLARGPGVQPLQVLAQTIGEHLRAGPSRPIRAHHLGRPLLARLVQVESQQPALDGAVVDAVRALGVNAQIPRQRRIAGENGRLPALESLAQHAAEFGIQFRQSRFRADAFTVRRIGDDQAGVAVGPRDLAERPLLHVHPIGDAGLLAVRDRHAHRVRVDVGAQDAAAARGARARRSRASSRSRSHSAASWPRHPVKPKYSRSSAGAASAAIKAASVRNVPEPHMGSTSRPPRSIMPGQPARSSTAAATFSLSGARPPSMR